MSSSVDFSRMIGSFSSRVTEAWMLLGLLNTGLKGSRRHRKKVRAIKWENGGSEQVMFARVDVFAGHVMMHFDLFGYDIKESKNIRRQSSIRIERV